jgi:cytochrome c-type biogenesis protein CcmF
MPISEKDEETYSREFWLFIGALVLTISCVQIVATTSIPVFNAVFGTKLAPPPQIIQHYNKWQVPFAVVITIISGFSQFLKYKNTDSKKFFKSLGLTLLLTVIVTALFVYVTKVYTNAMYIVLTFAAIFSIFSNGKLLLDALRGKWKLAGSSIAHIGFALLLIGALVSSATSDIVSVNDTGIIDVAGFEKVEKPGENLMLYLGEPVVMDKYTLTYQGDSVKGPNIYYKVNYKAIDKKTGKVEEEFTLYPNAQHNPKMGLVASPDTRHYLTYDIYTHATAAPPKEEAEHAEHEGHSEEEAYGKPITKEVSPGDTVRYRDGYIVVKSVNKNASIEKIQLASGDIAVGMELQVVTKGKTYTEQPLYLIKGGNKFDFAKTLAEAGLKLRFSNIYPERDKLELMIYQKPLAEKRWIVLKAIKFPYINLFWGGTIIMVIGFLLSIFRRQKELTRK